MHQLPANLYLAVLLTFYVASLLGVLFLTESAMLLGLLAFALSFIVGVIQSRFQRRPIVLKHLWAIVFPTFIVLFVITVVFSATLGAPETENLPVFAERQTYRFTRGQEVSRARFVLVSTCFCLAWHIFGMAIAAEQWANWRQRMKKHLR